MWVIMLITYVISLGEFSHVVAGSGEAWLLMWTGQTGFAGALNGFILPALAGNLVGGTGLFAVLAHGQSEMRSRPKTETIRHRGEIAVPGRSGSTDFIGASVPIDWVSHFASKLPACFLP